ncbi:MAG: hypothetical protein EPO11_02835, partial [Gammaproteobacteria bacterium]
MIIGASAIFSDGRYGMPEEHMEALVKAAEQVGAIGVRGVSPFASYYIQQGCPTKPFAVKNKSAKQGPAAGLIAIDPLYSRDSEATYEKYRKGLKAAYE